MEQEGAWEGQAVMGQEGIGSGRVVMTWCRETDVVVEQDWKETFWVPGNTGSTQARLHSLNLHRHVRQVTAGSGNR